MPKIQGSMSKYQILESAFKKIHEDINKDLPADIYHYTSFNGLENILKQRKLIYTDYRFFNDPTEIEYGKKLILHALIRDERIDRKIVQMIMVLFSNLESLYKIYVCCFSVKKYFTFLLFSEKT